MKSTKNILIYGVPGSGKTTISCELEKRLGYKNLELDDVRAKAQLGKNKNSDPFLFDFTTSAWEKFGDLNFDNAINGLLAIRKAMQPFIIDELKQHKESVIAEAAFLDPSVLRELGQCVLITCPNKEQHYNQFFVHRDHSPKTDLQFKAAKYIEKHLIYESRKLNIPIVGNNSDINSVVQGITSIIN